MNAILERLTVLDLSPAADDPWFWSAQHTRRWFHLPSTFSAVRPLIGACDGLSWPWTIVQMHAEAPCPFFQVLGTADRLLLEVGDGTGEVWTVYRTDRHGGSGWVQLPAQCAWWVSAIRPDEVFDAHEATSVGVLWLREGFIRGPYGVRGIHNPGSDGRN